MTSLSREQKALKTITRKLTDACGGATHCSELLDGKSHSLISAYGNPNDRSESARFMPLDDIVALERFAGRSIIGEWLVAQASRDPDRSRTVPGLHDLSVIAKEGGEAKSALASLIHSVMTSGRASEADRITTLKEMREAHAAYGRVIEELEGLA